MPLSRTGSLSPMLSICFFQMPRIAFYPIQQFFSPAGQCKWGAYLERTLTLDKVRRTNQDSSRIGRLRLVNQFILLAAQMCRNNTAMEGDYCSFPVYYCSKDTKTTKVHGKPLPGRLPMPICFPRQIICKKRYIPLSTT